MILASVESPSRCGRSDVAVPNPPLDKPDVCVSKSWMVISRCAGTSRCSGIFSELTEYGLMFSSIESLRTATCMSANSGMYFETGSSGRINPSSIIIIVATPRSGLVELIIMNNESSCIERSVSTSINP